VPERPLLFAVPMLPQGVRLSAVLDTGGYQVWCAVRGTTRRRLRMSSYTGIRIYCVGKIAHNGWRNQLFPIRGESAPDCERPQDWNWSDDTPIQELPGAVYVGPYFLSDDHGCYHSEPNSHGVAAGGRACGDAYPGLSRPDVVKRCLAAIESATHIFAWIDDPTAYGSLVEVGYARALGKKVHLYFKAECNLGDLWFVSQVSTAFAEAKTVDIAWGDFCLRMRRATH
jgi:hypothetical protein